MCSGRIPLSRSGAWLPVMWSAELPAKAMTGMVQLKARRSLSSSSFSFSFFFCSRLIELAAVVDLVTGEARKTEEGETAEEGVGG